MSRARWRYRGQTRSEVDARPAGLGARTTGIRPRRLSGGSAGTGWTDLAVSGPSPMILRLRRPGRPQRIREAPSHRYRPTKRMPYREPRYAAMKPRHGDPGRTRTCDLRIRNPSLYPTELRGRDTTNLGHRGPRVESYAATTPEHGYGSRQAADGTHTASPPPKAPIGERCRAPHAIIPPARGPHPGGPQGPPHRNPRSGRGTADAS